MLAVHTSGNRIKDNERGSPIAYYEYNMVKWGQMIFLIFGTYWTLAFWNNLCDFTVAGASVNAYFGKTESVVGGPFCGGFIYHFGSIAYGSLVLGPCAFFRLIFGWLQALARDTKPNAIQKLLGKLCCCILWPYEKLCMRMDDNAFSMVWLTKLNLCPSGKKDFYLNRRIGEKIGECKWIGGFYSICARFSIVSLTTYIAWLGFTKWEYYNTKLQNPILPTIVSFDIKKKLCK
jgi:Plasma-membrane choline transporter